MLCVASSLVNARCRRRFEAMSDYGKLVPSDKTSCMCSCGCFLVSVEDYCPICGSSNPCYGNKSREEEEAEFEDRDERERDDDH